LPAQKEKHFFRFNKFSQIQKNLYIGTAQPNQYLNQKIQLFDFSNNIYLYLKVNIILKKIAFLFA